jgi:polyhydroxyalkanoate synthesis regulator phasin
MEDRFLFLIIRFKHKYSIIKTKSRTKKEVGMPDRLKEGYLATLGIAAVTYDKAVEISKRLVKKGELAKDRQKKFIDNLMQESKKNISEMTGMLNEKMGELAKKGEPLKEKQDELIKDLAKKAREAGDMTGSKIKDIFREAKDKTKKAAGKIAGDDREKIKKALDDLDIPTREDLEEIRNKLDQLIRSMDSQGKAGPE